jgi:hypothetical protein
MLMKSEIIKRAKELAVNGRLLDTVYYLDNNIDFTDEIELKKDLNRSKLNLNLLKKNRTKNKEEVDIAFRNIFDSISDIIDDIESNSDIGVVNGKKGIDKNILNHNESTHVPDGGANDISDEKKIDKDGDSNWKTIITAILSVSTFSFLGTIWLYFFSNTTLIIPFNSMSSGNIETLTISVGLDGMKSKSYTINDYSKKVIHQIDRRDWDKKLVIRINKSELDAITIINELNSISFWSGVFEPCILDTVFRGNPLGA